MQVAHLLRKYNPSEWGGTETAVKRLLDGLRQNDVRTLVFCPEIDANFTSDPLREAQHRLRTYKTCVPVWGIPGEQKRQLIAVGGNLLSFDLLPKLLNEKGLSLIHTHAGNRLGGIALTAAKIRRIPLVATIHGGVLDLPASAREFLQKPLKGGVEWGKVFGAMLRARKVLDEADAILTCNRKEAELQQKRYPAKRIVVQPHAVSLREFETDCRAAARRAFPKIHDKHVLLAVGRIDPVKNQHWLVEQAPEFLNKFPNTVLVLAGSCTDAGYGKMLENKIAQGGLEHRVILTGGLPPCAPELVGLFQLARVVILPSLSETFGLVILEAWAARKPVLSSKTSGALDLVRHGDNGVLFDLQNASTFHEGLDLILNRPTLAEAMANRGKAFAGTHYDVNVQGARVKKIYEELIEEKK